ncbi:MAG TPA: tRNA (adenosine(37)-N6)-threonylcarbamoyltransferase complex ATPase subunit type 1 TsaE [Brevefilum sp.]|nr:tRNA (adenosine(37)-N6)-threonylcarbamoyltransferase complex ATPase subunit type 1 TsaE [Brevefilum sp.]HOR19017.1 tRNA (adenosine(37)-N6)-threonylcarbamoyltransferase complex ATPase subunit type 1 TsaE [Brevefilum sp.]HPL69304.1 tRNA (adenosine(37)-N6)-threonylcarbamoyltransferase complex ATPase subunit type 1 TsaE [Brevefilum sp.]
MPILDDLSFEFFSYSAEQTRRLGIHLGGYLRLGDIICLAGKLGSGKTTLVQGIGRGWGTLDPVTSPSYVIVNEYRRPDQERLFHLDAYRLESAQDAQVVDLDRMLVQGTIVIEWAERIQAALPAEHLWVQLEATAPENRTMLFTPRGARYESMVSNLRRKVYGVF